MSHSNHNNHVKKINKIQQKDSSISVSVRLKPSTNVSTSIDVKDVETDYAQNIFETSNQNEIFDKIALPALNDLEHSRKSSATIVVYGQTGSGKTHTIFGPHGSLSEVRLKQAGSLPLEWGLLPRVAMHLIANRIGPLFCSAVEIYQEAVFDLLNHRSPLQLKSSESKRIYAKGIPPSGQPDKPTYGGFHPPACTCLVCYNVRRNTPKQKNPNHTDKTFSLYGETLMPLKSNECVAKVIGCIEDARTSVGHLLNSHSSRSHCLVKLHFDSKTFLFVDLAGSERIEKSGVQGIHKGQAICINESLSVFGRVIRALGNRDGYIPYRDSTLTMLMKSSFEHNHHISLIVNVCSDVEHLPETKCTLEFARNVTKVSCKSTLIPSQPIETKEELLRNIQSLSDEVASLKAQGMHDHINPNAPKASIDLLETNIQKHKELEQEYRNLMQSLKEAKILHSANINDLEMKLRSSSGQLDAIRDTIFRQKTIPGLWISASPIYNKKIMELKDAQTSYEQKYGSIAH